MTFVRNTMELWIKTKNFILKNCNPVGKKSPLYEYITWNVDKTCT